MVRVWLRARRDYMQDGFGPNSQEAGNTLLQELHRNAALRQQFIDDLVALPARGEDDRAWRLHELTLSEDFPRFLERAQLGTRRRRRAYAELARITYYCEVVVDFSAGGPEAVGDEALEFGVGFCVGASSGAKTLARAGRPLRAADRRASMGVHCRDPAE